MIGKALCKVGLHRWRRVRVIKDLSLRGTDGRGQPMFTVNDSETVVQCARCPKRKP